VTAPKPLTLEDQALMLSETIEEIRVALKVVQDGKERSRLFNALNQAQLSLLRINKTLRAEGKQLGFKPKVDVCAITQSMRENGEHR